METLNMVSKNYKLVEALKLSNIKPCLSSINLMYIWAFKKEPISNSTYLGMLEDIFAHLENDNWISISPSEKFMQWINESNEIVVQGIDKYKQEIDKVLID